MIRHRVRALVVGLCFLSGGQVCPLAAKEPKQTPKNTISIQLAAPVKPQTFSRPVTFYVVDVIDRTGDPDPMLVYRTSMRLLWREFVEAVFLDREPKSIVRQALEDSLRAAGMLSAEEASAEYLLTVYLFSFGVTPSEAGLYSRVELNVAMKNPKTGNSEQVSGLGAAVEGRGPSPFAEPRDVRTVLTDALEAALRNFLLSTQLRQAVDPCLTSPPPTRADEIPPPLPLPSGAQPGGVHVVACRSLRHMKFSGFEVFNQAVAGVIEMLKARGVHLATDRVLPFVRPEDSTSVDGLINMARGVGANYVMLIVVDRPWTKWIKLSIRCHDLSGKLLWQEEASEGGGITGKNAVPKTLQKLKKKLQPHLGQLGLPLLKAQQS